ncbi:MAG: catalase [Gammaproteobacteria bacterium]|jgi:catalase|uniref:catalase n=1 Tax=Marisediminitalea TaxID=2662254 RepID=UPI000C466243|nr:catalase [Marisediminitalea aggregata]MBL52978.1 catalase [Alteromonadaceae bacterium]MCP3689797.1 catalase [Gammaproteobacteria bacterium]MCP3863097.1 catalase [Aestuariibacter sp.]MCP4529288.1 catalase [Aestuariibacter sp.]MCP4948043.1 catalase [Aestuariibacter sp.]|tara:strand:+ start:3030 stop:4484 length:1455 start_codon:yes stop_codon:yes gene_type:complete
MTKRCPLTTSSGAPVAHDNQSRTAGARGPVTFDNHYLFEKLAHFNRERIPERVVHARGSAAYGTFTLTKSLSDYTIADFLQTEGQQTPVFLRFSTVGGGQDSSDYARDPRGFAVKFYTQQGNWDMVGNNTPVFFLRDGIKFPDFIHSQKKNPRTNLPDPQAVYEFWANNPQSLHQATILMSDRGIPASYRHVNGYSSHTLSFWNDNGERYWVKWHFKTNQGIQTLTNEEAATKPAFGAQQDLVESIDKGDFPSWTVKVQIMTEAQAQDYYINPFDVTKVWPHSDFPLIEIGQLELNRNVDNFFAENEQAAFAPSNLVPGIGASPDRMLQARLIAYQDAQRYRMGANYNQIPVNAPRCPVHHYQRDGAFAGINPAVAGSGANFYPNDRAEQGAPAEVPDVAEPPMPLEQDAWLGIHDNRDDDNFSQAGDLFRLMSPCQKGQLVHNIAAGLHQCTDVLQQRMLAQYEQADPQYAAMVKQAIATYQK